MMRRAAVCGWAVWAVACGGGGGDTVDGSVLDTGATSATGTVDLGPGPYGVAYAGSDIGVDLREASAITLDGIAMTGYVASAQEAPLVGTNSVVDLGGAGSLVWGRWSGGTMAGEYYGAPPFTWAADGGLHYVAGAPVAAPPASGPTVWQPVATTPVTRSDGTIAPGTVTGSLGVAFAGPDTRVGVSLTLDLPGDGTYTVETTGGSADPSQSEVGMQSGGLFRDLGGLQTTGGAACGANGCFVAIAGLIAGANADQVGLVVHLYAGSGGAPETVSTALVFAGE